MQNPASIAKQEQQASFLARLSPERRKFLAERIGAEQFAELEQRTRKPLEPLEPVTRRVARQRPQAPKPSPQFYRLGNASPAELARFLRRARNRRAVAAIRVAAFSGRRGWDSAVACGVIRHAIALAMLADQRGVVRDVPLTLLRHAHRDRRTGSLPHPDTIGGGLHHPFGGLQDGQAGYARLLVQAGFMSRVQYRRRNPSQPGIAPSCNFYTLCEREIPITECATAEQCEATLAMLELASIPHPSSGVSPRPPPHPPP